MWRLFYYPRHPQSAGDVKLEQLCKNMNSSLWIKALKKKSIKTLVEKKKKGRRLTNSFWWQFLSRPERTFLTNHLSRKCHVTNDSAVIGKWCHDKPGGTTTTYKHLNTSQTIILSCEAKNCRKYKSNSCF